MCSSGPEFGPSRDASFLFGSRSIFIPGSERPPVPLAGRLRDESPCSEVKLIPDEKDLDGTCYTKVTINLAGEILHPSEGHIVLNELRDQLRGKSISSKTKKLGQVFNIIAAYYNVFIKPGFNPNDYSSTPFLSVSSIFVERENLKAVVKQRMTDALSAIFLALDQLEAPCAFGEKDAADLFMKDSIEIAAGGVSYTVPLRGEALPLLRRISSWKGNRFHLSVIPEVVDPAMKYVTKEKLHFVAQNQEFFIPLSGILEGFPIIHGTMICSIMGRHLKHGPFVRFSCNTKGLTNDIFKAIVKRTLHEFFIFMQTEITPNLMERVEQLAVSRQDTLFSPKDLTRLGLHRLLQHHLIEAADEWQRPISAFRWSDSEITVKVLPTQFHPIHEDKLNLNLILSELRDSSHAGGYVNIDFTSGYWEMRVAWGPQQRDEAIAALFQFLHKYIPLLRYGIIPGRDD